MKKILSLAALATLPFAVQAYDFSAIQQQIMNDPSVQQAVGQQVMKQATTNPAGTANVLGGMLGAGGAAGATGGNMSTLLGAVLGNKTAAKTPITAAPATGNAALMATAQAAMAKVLTPTEQKSLQAYSATPTGASVMSKMPALVEQLMPIMLQMYGAKK
jgi:hypothetical protein